MYQLNDVDLDTSDVKSYALYKFTIDIDVGITDYALSVILSTVDL